MKGFRLDCRNEWGWIYEVKRLVISKQVGRWCQLPYDLHSKGCFKFGAYKECPPNAPLINEVFNTDKSLYLVHSEFDLTAHKNKMRMKHPGWSDRQFGCVLYWQSTSRKQLKERIVSACMILGTNFSETVPEALGVNVYVTARLAGLKLERIRNLKICRHVALVGFRI